MFPWCGLVSGSSYSEPRLEYGLSRDDTMNNRNRNHWLIILNSALCIVLRLQLPTLSITVLIIYCSIYKYELFK